MRGRKQKPRTHRDGIPVLVHHHDAKEHAQCEEEEAVDVVFDGVADGDAERKEEDLCDGEKGGAKDDVADRPAVVEGAEDEDELGYDVDHGADERPEDVDDPESGRGHVVEPCEPFEGGDRDEEGGAEDAETRDAEELVGRE